jgi:hypothetical protein
MAMSTNGTAWLAASDVGRPELAPLLIFKSNSVQFGVRRR